METLLAAEERAEGFLDGRAQRFSEGLPAELSPGQRVGSYRVVREVGRGGMGIAYLAERADEAFDRQVVIKVLAGSWGDAAERLAAERRLLATLDHPNIARVLDGGTLEGGRPFLVLEYVEGLPIDRHCDDKSLPLAARLELFRRVCDAVSYAHRRLVVHRDLKPGNILVRSGGEPKLLDFGIAKVLENRRPAEGHDTAPWLQRWTPAYASPEQMRAEPATTATDVYSLGVLLYRLLTGVLPFPVAERPRREIERRRSEGPPERPSVVAQGQRAPAVAPEKLAGDLDAIVLQALRPRAEDRYGTVAKLAEDLRRHALALPVAARGQDRSYRLRRFLRRHRSAVTAAFFAVALILGFALAMTVQSWRLAQQRDEAQQARQRAETMVALLRDVFRVAYEDEDLSLPAAASRISESVDQLLVDEPAARAELLATTGQLFRNLGRFEEAEETLRKTLELHEEVGSEESPEAAVNAAALALVETWRGREGTAERAAKAVENLERVGSAQPAEWVATLNDLVAILCYFGRFSDADEPSRRALESSLALAQRDPLRAEALAQRAQVVARLGEPNRALDLYRQALGLHRMHRGTRHPAYAMTLVAMARAARLADRPKVAEAAYRQALPAQRRVFGNDSSLVALTLNNLAPLLLQEGRWDESEALYREALARIEGIYGAGSVPEILTLSGLAGSLVAAGRFESAEALLRRRMAGWQRSGIMDPRTAVAQSWLGAALTAQGRWTEGDRLAAAAYERLVEAFGEDHRLAREAADRRLQYAEFAGR